MDKREGAVDSFLGDRSRLEGTLTFNGTLTLLGKFKGKIAGGEEVVLGQSSESEVDVEASHVAVHGRMSGSIKAERAIEIHRSAEVEGDVSTPSLIIHEGAVFDGKCSMKRQRGRQARDKIVDLKDGWILSD
jgi:cytoskeletal protein CcmA (bactofilin family)